FRLMHETARKLGYAGYVELYEDIKGFDLRVLEALLRPLLEKTRAVYRDRMGQLVKERTGIQLSEAEKHDASFTFRAKQFDGFFPKENAVKLLVETLGNMGVNLESQKNIHLDVAERPKKDPRAFVSPVRVPGDIRLVVMPQGGHDDYATL